MAQEFKIGDVVELKSGGPRMTIENIDNYSFSGAAEIKAKCIWFDGKKMQENVFDLAVLAISE